MEGALTRLKAPFILQGAYLEKKSVIFWLPLWEPIIKDFETSPLHIHFLSILNFPRK